MKKFLSVLLLIAIALLSVACDNTNEPQQSSNKTNSEQGENIGTKPVEEEQKQDATGEDTTRETQREFELNKDNYQKYLRYTSETAVIAGAYYENFIHTISGVLSYAFYEDVVVTFYVTAGSERITYYSGTIKVELDASGYATFYADDPKIASALQADYDRQKIYTFTIKDIEGKVILPTEY